MMMELAERAVPEAVKAVGFHDPLQPPITDPATRGRIPYSTPQSLFLLLFVDAEEADVALAALQVIMPEVGRFITEEIGNTLIKRDSRYKRQWAPLKESTLTQRRAKGRMDDYPYSDAFAQQWQFNRWNQSLTSDEDSVTVGIGPSETTQSHTDWSKTHLSQYGTPPGHGDGPHNIQQKVARPLGISEEIARKAQTYLAQRLPAIYRSLGGVQDAPHAILAPDMMQADLPIWVQ